jgi:hypothetical protein
MPRNSEVRKAQTDIMYGAMQWLMLLGVVLGVVTAIRFLWIHSS